MALGRKEQPMAASRTLQLLPESVSRVGFDGYRKKKDSKVHMAVDTLGHLLVAVATPGNEQERKQVEKLAEADQEAMDDSVELAYVDKGCTGEEPQEVAFGKSMKLAETKQGITLLSRRWRVVRSFVWVRLSRDYERLSDTLEQIHCIVFAILMLVKAPPCLPIYLTG